MKNELIRGCVSAIRRCVNMVEACASVVDDVRPGRTDPGNVIPPPTVVEVWALRAEGGHPIVGRPERVEVVSEGAGAFAVQRWWDGCSEPESDLCLSLLEARREASATMAGGPYVRMVR